MHSRVIFKNLSGTLMVCFYVRIFYSFGIYFGISSGYVFSFVISPKKVSQLTQHERIIYPFLIVLNAIFIIYQIPINIYMISDLSSLLLICLCIPMLALIYLNFLCFIVYFNIWVRLGLALYPLSTAIFPSILTWLFFFIRRSEATEPANPSSKFFLFLFYWDQMIL